MAFVLREATGTEWDTNVVADLLKCPPSAAIQIALCFRPSALNFAQDVEQISEATGVDAASIANFARQADALEAFGRGEGAFLAAAREQLFDGDAGKSGEEP